MPSEFAPPGGKPRVTKKQIREMQENYKKAENLAKDTAILEAQEKATLDDVFAQEFEEVFTAEQKIGVYIGRFQPLHIGHENIIQQMIRDNDIVLIFIGTGGEAEKNPFSFSMCESFFSEYVSGNCSVQEIADTPDNAVWISNLAQMIDVHTTQNRVIHFYGGNLENDYAIQVVKQYIAEKMPAKIDYVEVSRQVNSLIIAGKEIAISGTLCRLAIENHDWDFLEKLVSKYVFDIVSSKYI